MQKNHRSVLIRIDGVKTCKIGFKHVSWVWNYLCFFVFTFLWKKWCWRPSKKNSLGMNFLGEFLRENSYGVPIFFWNFSKILQSDKPLIQAVAPWCPLTSDTLSAGWGVIVKHLRVSNCIFHEQSLSPSSATHKTPKPSVALQRTPYPLYAQEKTRILTCSQNF